MIYLSTGSGSYSGERHGPAWLYRRRRVYALSAATGLLALLCCVRYG